MNKIYYSIKLHDFMELYKVNFSKIKIDYQNKEGIIFNKNKIIINERIEDHFVQILFILKESIFFLESNKFSKDFLEEQIINDYPIYCSNWVKGNEFVKLFPEKIKLFLIRYCDKIITNCTKKSLLNLSLKQREQLESYFLFQ